VSTGQVVRLLVEGDTNVYTGRIARLSPALDERSRILRVEADVPGRGSLRPGLFARADIVIDDHQPALSVPAAAMVTFAGLEKIVLADNGKALERSVTTGRRGPDWIEVTSGLKVGDLVVVNPGGLRSGQPLTITNTNRPAAQTAIPLAKEVREDSGGR